MKKQFTLLLLAVLLWSTNGARGQSSNSAWYFGGQAGLRFQAGQPLPTPISGSAMTTYEACVSITDAAEQLLFYTNGEQIWDRTNAVMPNGSGLQSHISASQGALALQDPTNPNKYYLFTVDAVENSLVAGLRYSVVDMSLHGGLGDIGSLKNIAVSPPQLSLTEKLTAVRHANGRDYWIVVHGWNNNEFHSYLFTASGITAAPRTSVVGMVHSSGGGSRFNGNAVGHLKASPDGRLLACAIREMGLQLFDFNPETGAVSNARTLGVSAPYYYGAEFSADGTKLYTTDLTGNSVYQMDLSDNLRVVRVGQATGYTGALQRGPNGQIYVAVDESSYLGIIAKPNAAGLACSFTGSGIRLATGFSRVGLPNFPNAYATTSTLATAAGQPLAQVVVYPNPAHDRLWVSVPAVLSRQALTLTLFNSWGQRVLKQPLTAAGRDVQLPLPSLANGVYTVQLVAPTGESVRQKIVIQ